ncbi:inosine monophosphate dehydrogenase [Xylariomycetidae sp. FL2044]|nr:inosine monophosphate dehydrogenase [Xylariomycetidae sp. FL2044]
MADQLRKDYPWVKKPIIVNAPMAGFAGGDLAAAVTREGGIGMIGYDLADLNAAIERFKSNLASDPPPSSSSSSSSSLLSSSSSSSSPLPLGVGIIVFLSKLDVVLPVLEKHKPAIVWLFAATHFSDYQAWAREIRARTPETKIWVQIGSASAALEVANLCKPDVLVLQGSDAGGHGFQRGVSVVALFPETADLLRANGLGHMPLVAAGGLVDGRGVAAAMVLGAAAAVMGTRFLASPETVIHPDYRRAVLAAKDGALSTARSPIFDQLRGPNVWPELYDGRALTARSYEDWVGGVDIEKIRERYSDAAAGADKGFGAENLRGAVWAGAGVGLVNEVKPAGEIVREVRDDALARLRYSMEIVTDG